MSFIAVERIEIDDIKIQDRARADFGDIDSLAQSIQEVGLIQPICVGMDNYDNSVGDPDAKYILVDGHRRLLAYQKLGIKSIPALIVGLNKEKLLQAEYYANMIRKQFTPSEAVALAKKIEEVIAQKAKDRQSLGGKKDSESSANLAQDKLSGKKTRDIVSQAVGMSHETLKKATEIVESAKENPNNADLVQKMDETGKISPVYQELKNRQDDVEIEKANQFYDDEYGKIKQNLPKGKASQSSEIEHLVKKTGGKIVSLIVKMPDGRQKKMGSIASDWYQNKNIRNWIMENIDLGTNEKHKDIIIHREGNQIMVFDSDHVDNMRKAIHYLMDCYSFTGSLIREIRRKKRNGNRKTKRYYRYRSRV